MKVQIPEVPMYVELVELLNDHSEDGINLSISELEELAQRLDMLAMRRDYQEGRKEYLVRFQIVKQLAIEMANALSNMRGSQSITIQEFIYVILEVSFEEMKNLLLSAVNISYNN